MSDDRSVFDILGIISLGDANAYLLSTAEENLGVIAARSMAGRLTAGSTFLLA